MKYLLMLVLFGILWWVWRQRVAPSPPSSPRRPERPAEKMVACAHCGLLLPESDSVADGEQRYCGEAHRQAGVR
jgi:uncharacterized protein